MYDYSASIAHSKAYYANQPTDKPWTLMGFVGEFNFSDHSLVPELIQTLVLYSTKYERFRQVPLEEVNRIAREIHGGEPGVPLRILDRIEELHRERQLRMADSDTKNDKNTYDPELTIDDWSAIDSAPSVEKEERDERND